MARTFAIGGGIAPFSRPGSGRGYKKMGSEAARQALADAQVDYKAIDACVCSYNYAAPTAGQAAIYDLGLSGIPIFNTNNNCSSGSANIFLARNLILSGQYDTILCLGFEEMDGGLSEPFPEKASPTARQFDHMYESLDMAKGKVAEKMTDFTSDIIKLFAAAGREYCDKHGVDESIFSEISAKNRLHGQFNENAMLSGKTPPTAVEIAGLPKLYGSITSGMAAPTADGAAAVVLCSERWMLNHHRQGDAVEISGQSLVTDTPESFGKSFSSLAGNHMAQVAASRAYREAGILPSEIDVVELHDCFSPNELLLYESLQLADPGKASDFWKQREVTTNSQGAQHVRQGAAGVVVNPSGGLESKGHPIGATGLAQACELLAQLRGKAAARQIEPVPQVAVQHNFGFNGGAVVTVYRAPMPWPRKMTPAEVIDARPFAEQWGTTEEFDVSFYPGCARVQGEIPKDIRGSFFRNGPGMMDIYGTRLKHPIDGDGLIGRLTFNGDGRASFASRFVETSTHTEERDAKKMLFNGQMGSRAPSSTQAKWRDPAHTNVYAWGGKLMACHEYVLPHELDPHTLRTIGPTDLGGTLKHTKSLCAHFRYDQKLDVLVTVGFSPGRPAMGGPARPPRLHICEYDRNWILVRDAYHNIPGLNYVHDLAVTPSFYIVQQTPFVKVDLEAASLIMSGEKMPGEQMHYYEGLPCRVILIPRGGGEPILIDLPKPVHAFHFGNACEGADGRVDVDLVGLGRDFNMDHQHGLWLSNGEDEPGILYAVRVDPHTATCLAMRQLDRCSCEFPAVHPGMHVNGPTDPVPRFTYLMANDSGRRVPFTHVVKVDRCHKDRQSFAAKGAVGEPCFIPRAGGTSEDDGYVVVQVYDPQSHTSSFQILDAKEISRGPVCTLSLDRFLPTAFHGTWCGEVYGEVNSRL